MRSCSTATLTTAFGVDLVPSTLALAALLLGRARLVGEALAGHVDKHRNRIAGSNLSSIFGKAYSEDDLYYPQRYQHFATIYHLDFDPLTSAITVQSRQNFVDLYKAPVAAYAQGLIANQTLNPQEVFVKSLDAEPDAVVQIIY
jgi:hypothetical protein